MKYFSIETNSETRPYDYLARLSDDRWAYEFARRNPELRQQAAQRRDDDISERRAACAPIRILRSRVAQTFAERWGFAFMPDLTKDGYEADAVWSHYVFPDQVAVDSTPGHPGEACEIFQMTLARCTVTHVTDRSAREYLLIRREGRVVQVRCTGHTLLGPEPTRMKLQFPELQGFEQKQKLHHYALEVCGTEPISSAVLWTKKTEVLRNGLIALDAQEAGMSQRDIASLLHGPKRVADEWEFDGGALRASVRYAISKAEALRDGGFYRDLLGSRLDPARLVA